MHTAWGELFLEKYNNPDALRSFQDALQLDEDWAPALVGTARVLANENPPAARGAVERALGVDESNVAAHLFVAELELGDRNRGAAGASIERALEVNPRSLEALSLRAAVAWLEDRADDFAAEVERVLAINPAYGDVYRIAGSQTARAYRFPEAVSLVRRALEVEPGNTRAWADLGMHLLRTGDEPAARAALERSFADDPLRRGDLQPPGDDGPPRRLRDRRAGRPGRAPPPRRGAGAAGVRPGRRAGGARRALRAVRHDRPHPDPSSRCFRTTTTSRCARWACPACSARSGRASDRSSPWTRRAPGRRATSTGCRRCGTRWPTSSRCRCPASGCRAG